MTPFHGKQILGFFHYADYPLIPVTGTDDTGIVFGDAKAYRTKAHPGGNFK